MKYSEEIDTETRNRTKLALAAIAYEINDSPIMTDEEFDSLARKINLEVKTRRPDLDEFFLNEFTPDTGMWIYKHPELEKLKKILVRYF